MLPSGGQTEVLQSLIKYLVIIYFVQNIVPTIIILKITHYFIPDLFTFREKQALIHKQLAWCELQCVYMFTVVIVYCHMKKYSLECNQEIVQ